MKRRKLPFPGTVTLERGRHRARVAVDKERIPLGVHDTWEQAAGAIAEFWRLHAKDVAASPGLITVAEWGRRYLDERETDGVHRSVDSDRSVWAARIDASELSAQCIDTLSPRDVRAWIANQVRTVSDRTGRRPARSTVSNALNLLRVALEAAVEAGLLETNPARDVRVPKIARGADPWDWYRDHELDKLLGCAELGAEQRRILTVAAFTGLRKGELWGLQRADVDVRRSELVVSRSYDGPTKGGKARRVPLLRPALDAILEQPRRGELIFPTREGELRSPSDSAGLEGACKLAGVRALRFHDLRHTCASHLLQGTWAPELLDRALRLEEVQHWLGHRSRTTTERYAHLCPDAILGRVSREDPAADPSGRKWPRLAACVPEDVAQLAGIITTLEPPIRIERTTYGLRNRDLAPVIPDTSLDLRPLRGRILAMLEAYAAKKRPADRELVGVLAEALEAIERIERRLPSNHASSL